MQNGSTDNNNNVVLDVGDAFERERLARHCKQMQEEDEQRRHEDMEIHARTAYLRMRLGDFYIRSGKVDRALAEYKRAVKMDQDNAVFRTRLGDTYVIKDLVQQAMTQYRRAIQSDPDLADPRLSLGDLYRRFGMNVQALEQYRLAVELEPTRAYYHFKYADTLAAVGRFEEAGEEYRALLQLAPVDAFYRFRYGDLQLRLGARARGDRALQRGQRPRPLRRLLSRSFRRALPRPWANRGSDRRPLARAAHGAA